MALTCDHCGRIMGEDEYITVPFEFTQDKLGGASADDWFYYCAADCSPAVRGMLENLRRSGHEGESTELRWELVGPDDPQEKAPPAPSPARRKKKVPERLPGKKLRRIRVGLGLSQREVGRALDPPVHQAKVSTWENEKASPDLRQAEQLLAFFEGRAVAQAAAANGSAS